MTYRIKSLVFPRDEQFGFKPVETDGWKVVAVLDTDRLANPERWVVTALVELTQ